MNNQPVYELSIIMPCLNEAETVETCVKNALLFLEKSAIAGEVIVADNGSTDGSRDLARKAGARVVDVTDKGYGNALLGGIRAALGKYIIMGWVTCPEPNHPIKCDDRQYINRYFACNDHFLQKG